MERGERSIAYSLAVCAGACGLSFLEHNWVSVAVGLMGTGLNVIFLNRMVMREPNLTLPQKKEEFKI